MKLFFLPSRSIRLFAVLALVLLLAAFMAQVGDTLARKALGVKPGVSIEGVKVEGLLKHELQGLVEEMAKARNRPPQNAALFGESGEIIHEQAGLQVDIDDTVDQALSSPSGSNVHLTVRPIQPDISRDFFKPVYQGNPARPEVALCINVAWGEEYLPAVLEILARGNAKATFFFVGTWVRQFPDLVKRIHTARHEVANHGFHHGHPTQMGRAELERLIVENQDMLERVCGTKLNKLFAPPYGEVNEHVTAIAAGLGFRTIMWTRDTVDWKRPTPDVIIARACTKAENGTIVLMHPTGPTVVALPGIIQNLRGRGFELVTVSQLLRP